MPSFNISVITSQDMQNALTEARYKRAILRGNKVIGKKMISVIKRGIRTGPRTGRIYKFRGKKIRSSAAGEYPKNRTGALAKSINFTVANATKLEVGSKNILYAPILQQYKTPDQRTSVWRKIAPRPFLTKAHDELEGGFIGDMSDAIKQEIGL